jgi:hypothetical protein
MSISTRSRAWRSCPGRRATAKLRGWLPWPRQLVSPPSARSPQAGADRPVNRRESSSPDSGRAGDKESGDARHIATPEPFSGNARASNGCGLEPADRLRRRASAGGYFGHGHEGGIDRAGDCDGASTLAVATYGDSDLRSYADIDRGRAHEDADSDRYSDTCTLRHRAAQYLPPQPQNLRENRLRSPVVGSSLRYRQEERRRAGPTPGGRGADPDHRP